MPKVEVSLSPIMYDIVTDEQSVVVVVDILRATSAICTAFEHGAAKIIPVRTVNEAKAYLGKDYLVGAERGGEKVEGFDFGNSPYDYLGHHVKDQIIVLTTTNGTKAIDIAKNAHQIVTGSFINISSITTWLTEQKRDVIFLCAGWRDRFNLEDALFAGAAVGELAKLGGFDEFEDSAIAVRYLYEKAQDDPMKFLANSSHRRRLARLNLKNDIKYCFTPDQGTIIPILKDGALVPL